jgi:uncharacterized protein
MGMKIIDVKKEEREKRFLENIPFQVKEMNQDEESKIFTFEGYASTFGNVDLVMDRVVKGAFLGTIDQWKKSGESLPILWHHNSDMPLGVYSSLAEDSIGLKVTGTMPIEDTFVSGRIIPQMRHGSIRKMSIGYYLNKYTVDEETGIWDLLEIELFEISLVTRPANPMASVTDIQPKALASVDDLEHLSKREMETLFRTGVSFSKKDAKRLVSLICKSDRDGFDLTERDAEELKNGIINSFLF